MFLLYNVGNINNLLTKIILGYQLVNLNIDKIIYLHIIMAN